MRLKSGRYVSRHGGLRHMAATVLASVSGFATFLRLALPAWGLIGLSACSGIHLNDMMGSAPPAPQPVAVAPVEPGAITGSIAPSGSLAYAGSDHTDWDLVLATVDASLASPPGARIEWTNKTTGDSGTITDLAAIPARKPRDCRAFSTTIASLDGVHLYHAEICKSFMNTWEFAKLVAADAT